jgi:polyhydroxybutyrate depolymerase
VSALIATAPACATEDYDAITPIVEVEGNSTGNAGNQPPASEGTATPGATTNVVATAGAVDAGGSAQARNDAAAVGPSAQTGSDAAVGPSAQAGSDAAVGSSAQAGSDAGLVPSASDSSVTTACPAAGLRPGDTNETIQVGNAVRSYFLHVPASYDGADPVPLIVDFHFLGNSGEQEQQISPFPAVTRDEGVIIAYPDGMVGPAGRAWNIGPCCVGQDVDDVAFVKALVDQLRSRACIDPKRIYAVGYAMGGGMAHYIGCQAADVFAAVVPVGFDLLAENTDACEPSRPITVVQFRELSDNVVPYRGGTWNVVPDMPVTLLGAEATFARWAELDGCTGLPAARDDNGCAFYEQCLDGVEVVLCTKEAGVPVPDNGQIAWPILRRHSLP